MTEESHAVNDPYNAACFSMGLELGRMTARKLPKERQRDVMLNAVCMMIRRDYPETEWQSEALSFGVGLARLLPSL